MLLKLIPLRFWFGALAFVGALAGLAGWNAHERGIGDARTAARYEAALKDQRVKAARKLADLQIDADALTKALQDFHNNQGVKDVENTKTVGDLRIALRDSRGVTGRLFDPNQAGCRTSGSSAEAANTAAPGAGPDDAPKAGRLLSVQLTDLLDRLLYEADTINDAYIASRADAEAVRKACGSR